MKNNKLFDFLINRLKHPEKITLSIPEDDSRVFQAIDILKSANINIISHDTLPSVSKEYIESVKTLKFLENWPAEDLKTFLNQAYIKSLLMLKHNDVDAVICGCTMSTADIVRNAIRIIGMDSNSKWITSMFLMINETKDKFLTFSDCAVIPEPTSEQLVEIAEKAGEMHYMITGDAPRIAFLSFSTKGSAEHYRVSNVRKAVEFFSKRHPNIIHDGEIQLDAAINKHISDSKIKESKLKGDANSLIFPNLDAGNIGYKLTQQLAGYYACGPLLLGLNKPVNDLSRGATVEDIVMISLITAIQCEGLLDANL